MEHMDCSEQVVCSLLIQDDVSFKINALKYLFNHFEENYTSSDYYVSQSEIFANIEQSQFIFKNEIVSKIQSIINADRHNLNKLNISYKYGDTSAISFTMPTNYIGNKVVYYIGNKVVYEI